MIIILKKKKREKFNHLPDVWRLMETRAIFKSALTVVNNMESLFSLSLFYSAECLRDE